MQLLDELSMIYMACTAFYAMYSFDQTRTVRLFIFIFITSVAGFITGYYHYLKDPAFHQNMFALLAAVVIFKVIYEMEILLRPSRQANPRKSQNNGSTAVSMNDREQARIGKRDAAILNQMWRMAACGIVSLGLGFLIWNLDNIYCDVLRSWRRQVGLPWGIVLEGHGWW